jgi:hypothetical protein
MGVTATVPILPRAAVNQSFLRRAITAGFGWGGAGPHSHTAAFLFKDGAGNPLDGHAATP